MGAGSAVERVETQLNSANAALKVCKGQPTCSSTDYRTWNGEQNRALWNSRHKFSNSNNLNFTNAGSYKIARSVVYTDQPMILCLGSPRGRTFAQFYRRWYVQHSRRNENSEKGSRRRTWNVFWCLFRRVQFPICKMKLPLVVFQGNRAADVGRELWTGFRGFSGGQTTRRDLFAQARKPSLSKNRAETFLNRSWDKGTEWGNECALTFRSVGVKKQRLRGFHHFSKRHTIVAAIETIKKRPRDVHLRDRETRWSGETLCLAKCKGDSWFCWFWIFGCIHVFTG